MENKKMLAIELDLVQGILEYLSKHPYKDVYLAVQKLTSLKTVDFYLEDKKEVKTDGK